MKELQEGLYQAEKGKLFAYKDGHKRLWDIICIGDAESIDMFDEVDMTEEEYKEWLVSHPEELDELEESVLLEIDDTQLGILAEQ
jgi:hypothetical protein